MRSSTLCRCLLLLLARPTGIIGPAEEPTYPSESPSELWTVYLPVISLLVLNLFSLLSRCSFKLLLLNRERELVRLAQQSFHDIATHAVDFTYVTKLLWAETDNFPGLETTVEEQVGHSMLMSVRKKCFEDLPHLTEVNIVFHFWLSWPRQ